MAPSLLLTYDFPPLRGGIARALGELARHYPADELIVSTGAVAGSAEADAAVGARVDRIGVRARRLRTLPGLLLWSRRAVALARETTPEFVWCGNLRPAAYVAKWVRERVGVPYGILVHGADLLSLQHRLHQSRIKKSTVRSLIGSASVIVANSQWTRERCAVLLGELGIGPSPGRIHVVPLGADPVRFRPGIATGPIRERYGLDPGRWLLTVAKLSPFKGVDVALRALATLRDRYPAVRYAVAGTGEQQGELEQLARDLGLADRVRFLNNVADDDLPALYNLAEVYVGVSRQSGLDVEGFGLALLEASACGIPVVAGRSGGIPDAVRDGETGLLVDSEDPPAVAGAIAELLDSEARARALGLGGRAAVESRYNWDRVVSDLRAISGVFHRERTQAPPS